MTRISELPGIWWRRMFRRSMYCKQCGRMWWWPLYVRGTLPCPACGAFWWRDESDGGGRP